MTEAQVARRWPEYRMAMIGVIEFAAAGWLTALAALALPVFAHLLNRRGGLTLTFPTIRFVQQARAHHQRRFRLRNLVLLLLRCAILAAIVLAFAQPIWYRTRPHANIADGVDVVIVVDASASMTRTQRGVSVFDEARYVAERLIGSLDAGKDRAAVIIAGAGVEHSLPRLSGNMQALLESLASARPALARCDLDAAISEAIQMPADPAMKSDSARIRQVHVISDLQRTQWAGVNIGLRPGKTATDGTVGPVELYVHAVGSEAPRANVALIGPRIRPARPVVGQGVTITIDVANYGPTEVSRTVRLEQSNGRRQSTMAALKPGARKSISFFTSFAEPGLHEVVLRIDDPGFSWDNETVVPVTVRAKLRVGLISRSEAGDLVSGSYFLSAALAPDADSIVEVIALGPAQAKGESIARAQLDRIVICEAGRLGEGMIKALHRYVADGGGLFWIVDSAQALASCEAFERFDRGSQAVLPIALVEWIDLPPGDDQGLGLTDASSADLVLGSFDGAAMRAMASVKFRGVAAGQATASARELFLFPTGEAALAVAQVGRGRIVMLAAAIDPQRSNLVKKSIFPALVHEILAYLAPTAAEAGDRRFLTGEPITLPLPDGAVAGRLRIDPELSFSVVTAPGESRATIQIDPASRPGVVRISELGEGPGQVPSLVGVVGVDLDPLESDLRLLDDSTLARLTGGPGLGDGGSSASAAAALRAAGVTGATAARGSSSTPTATEVRPFPQPMWPWCLAAALILAGLEQIAASRNRSLFSFSFIFASKMRGGAVT